MPKQMKHKCSESMAKKVFGDYTLHVETIRRLTSTLLG